MQDMASLLAQTKHVHVASGDDIGTTISGVTGQRCHIFAIAVTGTNQTVTFIDKLAAGDETLCVLFASAAGADTVVMTWGMIKGTAGTDFQITTSGTANTALTVWYKHRP